jgi:SH3-like domain-containing protein
MADVIAGGNQNVDLRFMKMNYCLMLSMFVAASAVAQNNPGSPNPLPPIPAPATAPAAAPAPAETAAPEAPAVETNAPAKKASTHHHRKSTKKAAKAAAEKTEFTEAPVTLVPGPAEVFVNNLNVRGQAGLNGEVVAHLQKGDTVTVVSQITLDKHKANEPSQWAKIALPTGADVWVRSSFIDSKDKTVLPKRLNLRAGPSEDYSVLGIIERGTVVNVIDEKGGWSKIEAPTNAFAFIAAMYLKQEASGSEPVSPAPSTETGLAAETNTIPTTLMTVAEPQPIANQTPEPPQPAQPVQPPQPTEPAPAPNNNSTLLPPPINSETNAAPGTDNGATVDTNLPPPPPRVVTHEGFVRSSVSPVAPTYYELFDPTTQTAIDYLRSSTTNLDLSRYDGFHIIVTGEEGLADRWKDTPVLTVQRIYVLATNTPTQILKSPRARSAH